MTQATRPPIFLHCGFRSGSTWFWHRFRRTREAYAYYEPFHETLASLRLDSLPTSAAEGPPHLRHPLLNAPYHAEYRALLRQTGGVPFYELRMALLNYFDTGPDAAQLNYIELLMRHAQDRNRVPLLGFCRSLGRVGWFREYCPGINIVTLRAPWNRWMSYHRQTSVHGNSYFEFMAFSIALIGRRHGRYRPCFAGLALPELENRAGGDLGTRARNAFDALDERERLRIFLRVFVLEMWIATRHADHVVDLDRLGAEPAYCAAVTETLRAASGLVHRFHETNHMQPIPLTPPHAVM